MNVFDANKNLEEWMHNDWESDDYIRNGITKSNNGITKSNNNEEMQGETVHVSKFLQYLYILFFRSSILSIILWIVLIFGIVKLANSLMDYYFIKTYPEFSYLWQK